MLSWCKRYEDHQFQEKFVRQEDAFEQLVMLMARLHAHESSQLTVEKLKYKRALTSEAFKINILLRGWQGC